MAELVDLHVNAVWEMFSAKVRAFIASRVSDQSFVDDLVQEVFLKIHLHLGEVKESARLPGWVFTVANHTLADHYRKKKIIASSIVEEPHAQGDPKDCAACEIADGLEGMARALPPPYAKAIMLADFEGLSFAEVAKRLFISVSEAKSRVQRARRMIRDSLMRCCHFVFDRYGTIIDYHPAHCCCCCNAS